MVTMATEENHRAVCNQRDSCCSQEAVSSGNLQLQAGRVLWDALLGTHLMPKTHHTLLTQGCLSSVAPVT